MNSVNLIGNLTKDPEVRHAGASKVASLRLAVNGRRKMNDEWVDVPNFFNVTLWGRQAELAAEYLEKGRQVAISGRLQWHEWEAEDGSNRQSVEVVCEQIDYLAKPRERDEPDAPAEAQVSDEIPY